MRTLLFLTACTATLFVAAQAHALNDSNSAVNGSTAIQVGGANTGTINAGPGSGSTNTSLSNTNNVRNDNTNLNVNSANSRSRSSSRSTSSAKQGQFQAQSQNAHSSVDGSGNSENFNSVYVAAQKRNPVATAYAAPLALAYQCGGSASFGVQAPVFGFSGGSTNTFEACETVYLALTMISLGKSTAGLAILCTNEKIAEAMAYEERGCPNAPLRDVSEAVARDDDFAVSSGIGNGSPRKN